MEIASIVIVFLFISAIILIATTLLSRLDRPPATLIAFLGIISNPLLILISIYSLFTYMAIYIDAKQNFDSRYLQYVSTKKEYDAYIAQEYGVKIVLSVISILLAIVFIIITFRIHKLARNKLSELGVIYPNIEDGYINMGAHVLLLLTTGWIWILIWVYRLTHYTNVDKTLEPRDPMAKLLLCSFVPFYYYYWVYKTSQRIDNITNETGKIATLSIIVSLLIPMAGAIIMQNKINVISSGTNTDKSNHNKEPISSIASTSTADELKKYKELLDNGAITQEEFDAKKKQLLEM